MTWVHDDGKVRHRLQHGHCSDVECVASGSFKGADTAFTENDLRIARHGDHLRGTEKVFERGRHAALEQNRPSTLSESFKESIVLHAARAHLHDVSVFGDEVDIFLAHHLGNDEDVDLIAEYADI